MDNTRHNDPDFSPDDGYLEDDASQSIVQGGSFEQKAEDQSSSVFIRFIRSFAKAYRRLMDGGSDPTARKRRARYRNKPSSVPAQVQLLEARILMSGTSTTAVLSQPLTQVDLHREASPVATNSPTSTTSSSETSTPQVTTFAPLGEGVHTGEVIGVLDNGIGVTVWNGANPETGAVTISNTGLMTAGTNETLGKQHLSIDFTEGREHVTSVNLLVSPDFIGSVLVSDIEGSAREIYVMGGGNYLKTVTINETCGSFSLITDQGTASLVSMTFAPSTKPDTAPDLSTQTFEEFWAKAGAEQLKSGTDAERNILQTIETMKFDTTDQLQEVTDERTQLLPIIEDLKKPTIANVTQTVTKPVTESFAGLSSTTKEIIGVGKLSTVSDFGWTVENGIYKTTTGTWGSFGFELVTPIANTATQVTFSVTGRSQLQVRGSNFSQTLLTKDLTAGTQTVTLPTGAKYIFISVPSGSGTKPQFLSITTNRTVTETVQKSVPADPLKLKHADALTKVIDGLVAHANEETAETQKLSDTFEAEKVFAREPMLRHALEVRELSQKISLVDRHWSPENYAPGSERAKAMNDRETELTNLQNQSLAISSVLTSTYDGSLTEAESAVRDEYVKCVLTLHSLTTTFGTSRDALRFSIADRTYSTLSLSQNFSPTVTAVSTDNAFIATASSDGRIVLYASGSGEALHTFTGFTGTMSGLTFVNPTTLLVSSGQTATLVDLTTNITRTIDTQGRTIMNTQVMKESGTIALTLAETSTAQRTVRIVKSDGTLIRDIPCGNSFDHIKFSDDGSSYVFFEGSSIYVRSTETGRDSFTQSLGRVSIAGTVMDGNAQSGRVFTIYNDSVGMGYITAHTAQGTRLSSYNFSLNSAVTGITDLGDGTVAVTLRQSYPNTECVMVMSFTNNTWTLIGSFSAPTSGWKNLQTTMSADGSTLLLTRNDGITACTLPQSISAQQSVRSVATQLQPALFTSAPGDIAGRRFTEDMKVELTRILDSNPLQQFHIDTTQLKQAFLKTFPEWTDAALKAKYGDGRMFVEMQYQRDTMIFQPQYQAHLQAFNETVDRLFIATFNAVVTEAQFGDPTPFVAEARLCEEQLRTFPQYQGLSINRLTQTSARELVIKAIQTDPERIITWHNDYTQGSARLWDAMNSPGYAGGGSATPTPREAYEAQVTATRTLTTILQSEGTTTPELRAAAYLAKNPAAQKYVSLLTPTQQTQIASGQMQWSGMSSADKSKFTADSLHGAGTLSKNSLIDISGALVLGAGEPITETNTGYVPFSFRPNETKTMTFTLAQDDFVNIALQGATMRDMTMKITGTGLPQEGYETKTAGSADTISLRLNKGTYTVTITDTTKYEGTLLLYDAKRYNTPSTASLSVEATKFNSSRIEGIMSIEGSNRIMPVSMSVAEFVKDEEGNLRRNENYDGKTLGIKEVSKLNPNLPVWVVVHGREDKPTSGKMTELAKALTSAGYQVVECDWQEAAKDNVPHLFGMQSENWIEKAGDSFYRMLKSAGVQGENVFIAGHSFGSLVGYEIAERFSAENGKGVQAIVALDSAKDVTGQFGYDAAQVNFAAVSTVSWAFHSSFWGSNERALQAGKTIEVRSPGVYNITDEHGLAVTTFANLVRLQALDPNNQIASQFKLSDLANKNPNFVPCDDKVDTWLWVDSVKKQGLDTDDDYIDGIPTQMSLSNPDDNVADTYLTSSIKNFQ